MAGLWSSCTRTRSLPLKMLPSSSRNTRIHGVNCCSAAPNGKSTPSPLILKIAVSGVTELLRLFSSAARDRAVLVDNESRDEVSVSNVDDVLTIIKSDYEKAYFVTGLFTSVIYAEDCIFEDPTIKFQGTELYARNLNLLVPFFDNPSIQLTKIEEGFDSEAVFAVASWKLRTYLKLPWKPLISIDGRTKYDLDEEFRVSDSHHLFIKLFIV
ncbi:hypothetical protein ACJIZ3_015958 [Penstemon smallii]|uniref:Uncharacterized protein n=1 Tax=Penstemon smallii TaxID=265156 RepID=A0ABD3RP31_9LAMI